MIITNITSENSEAYEQLMPEDMYMELADASHFALGAVVQETAGTDHTADSRSGLAAGILLYDLIEEEGEIPYVLLKWIYVAQDFRNKGAANALMEKFYAILNEAGLTNVVCEIPTSPDDDLLCFFLEAWGFSFTYRKRYELTLSLEEMLEYPFFEDPISLKAVKPIRVMSRTQIKQELSRLAASDRQAKKLLQPEGWDRIDTDISCGTEEAGTIRGIFLVRRRFSRTLEPLFLHGSRENRSDIAGMLQYAAIQAVCKYPLDTLVHITCRNMAFASLIEALFPDQEPYVVRHGEVSGVDQALAELADIEKALDELQSLEEKINGYRKQR